MEVNVSLSISQFHIFSIRFQVSQMFAARDSLLFVLYVKKISGVCV